ncbi:MAG TPA: glycoside hydrolase family 31 protein [Gaiellaceae bacterium]|nr:glycoside hydrolase family 31 protein [Gaiellaceae bacterium]
MTRPLHVVAVGAALTAFLAVGVGEAPARTHAADQTPAPWTVQREPFALRFAKVSQAPARMSYVTSRGSRHRLGGVVSSAPVAGGTEFVVSTDEPGRRAHVRVTKSDLGVRVRWRLEPGADVVEVHEAFAAPGPQHFLGSGQREGYVDLVGQIVPLKVSADCATTLLAPYFASTAGWALRLEGSATGQIQFKGLHPEEECKPWVRGRPLCALEPAPEEVRLCLRAPELEYEVYTGTLSGNLTRFTARTGRPRVPAKSQFALVKWRDEVGSHEDLLEDVTQFQQRRIPIGWVMLDNPWESVCFGSLSWDRRRVGDPAATIAAVRARGVRFMMWVSPYVRCPPAGYAAPALLGGDRATRSLDLTDAATRAEYERRLREVFALGVDGVKGDRGDEHDLEQASFAGGAGASLHNAYPSLFGEIVMRVLRSVRGTDTAAMFRAGWSGAQRHVPAFWAGDQDGTWEGLRRATRAGQTASVSGFPVWGSDVGGYRSEGLTSDVFVRWAQLGAVSPLLEVGGRGPHERPWEWGEPVMDALRRAAVLHYELFPYLYELTRRSTQTGAPVLRPLGWDFPTDGEAWKRDLQLLVGPDLLAAPVTGPGETAPVYLPRGGWIDLWRGTRVDGPRKLVRKTPLAELPLYLRRGSAIPFDFRTPELWPRPWEVDDLGRPDRAGWLVAPGDRPAAAAAASVGSLRVRPVRRGFEVMLRRSPREVQLLLVGVRRPQAVLVGGRKIGATPTAASLRARASGWTWVGGPIPGIAVKLDGTTPSTVTIVLR